MTKWKKLFDYRLTGWRLAVLGLSIVLMIVSEIMLLCQKHNTSQLVDQCVKDRWTDENDFAEVSIFFPVANEVNIEQFQTIQHSILKTLEEVSLEADTENRRSFIDCFYQIGSITVNRGSAKLDLTAYGVSKDFFLFHPMKFVSGEPIPSGDAMRDYVVIDEKTAWNLFGATDVAGMTVYVEGIPHIISGVIEKAEDRLSELAGNDQNIIYVTNETLTQYGTSQGYIGYELLAPEPYEGFALSTLKDVFSEYETTAEFVDNTKRYGYKNLFENMKAVKSRHMQSKAVIYPYWENVARYYDAHYANLCMVRIGLFLLAVIMLVILCIDFWKHRLFHKEDIKNKCIKLIENMREKKKEKKKGRKII